MTARFVCRAMAMDVSESSVMYLVCTKCRMYLIGGPCSCAAHATWAVSEAVPHPPRKRASPNVPTRSSANIFSWTSYDSAILHMNRFAALSAGLMALILYLVAPFSPAFTTWSRTFTSGDGGNPSILRHAVRVKPSTSLSCVQSTCWRAASR